MSTATTDFDLDVDLDLAGGPVETEFHNWTCPIASCRFENTDEVLKGTRFEAYVCGSCTRYFDPSDINLQIESEDEQ